MDLEYANMTKKDHDAENVMVVKSANMTREDHNAEIATVVKSAYVTNLDLHAESAKGTTSANMTNLNKFALIAMVLKYANQDMTHITLVAGLEEIGTTADSAHIVLQIYFQMIQKH